MLFSLTEPLMLRLLLLAIFALAPACRRPPPVEPPAFEPVFYRGDYLSRWDIPYGDHERHVLDLHLRGEWATSEGPMNVRMEGPQPPTVVFAHGSAWYISDKREWEHFISPFLQRGYNVVNLNYRLREGIGPAIDDVRRALAFLLEHNDTYGLDLDRVFLTGASAGGHMSTFLGASQNAEGAAFRLPEEIGVAGVVNIVGGGTKCFETYELLRDHEVAFWRDVANSFVDDPATARAEMDAICPVYHFSEDDPPMFFAHGDLDEFGTPDKYMEMQAALEGFGVPVERVGYPNSGHTFIQEDWQDVFERILAFIDRYAEVE